MTTNSGVSDSELSSRVEDLRKKVQEHNDRVNLLRGRIQSLDERLGAIKSEIQKSGLTVEQLAPTISSIRLDLEKKISEIEGLLESTGY